MEWFEGGVREAISAAKAKRTVFVVVVTEQNGHEESEKLKTVLEDAEVVDKFSNMICIRLENGTPTCSQFAAIYPVILIPSIYFIDSSTGVDIEITGGVITKESLSTSFEKVKKSVGGVEVPAKEPSENVESVPEASVSVVKSESSAVPASSAVSAASSSVSAGQSSLNERVERAKQLVEQRKMEKERDEQEKEKSKEVERREIGKAMLERKRMLEEKELRDAAAQRRKDKEEERLAREKVKAQLEQDKLEKRMKFQAEKAAEQELRKENEKAALASAAEEAERRAAERATSARIQFRLPDGSSQTQLFPSESPLSEVYNFVRTGLTTKYSNFSLSTTFPRRNLDTLDMSNTLKNLQLAPSATVMVLPTASSSVSLQDGGFLSMLWLLLTPFTVLWTMLTGFFSSSGGSSTDNSSGNRSGGGGNRVKREGGIGRLRTTDFSDDENNTYNGNSTQQQ